MHLYVEGIDSLIEDIDKLNPSPAELKLLLQSGADTFVPLQKQIAESYEHRLTGKMIANIEPKYESEKVAYIYPQGTDSSSEGRHSKRHPVRNATKAFIANFGREKQPATHWVENSVSRGADPVVNAMQTKFNEILKSKGLI